MKKALIAAAATAVVLLAVGGGAGAVAVPAFDQAWLQHSIQGDRFEITGGMWAERHAQTPQVKALAAQVVGNHRHALNEAVKVAHELGIKVPMAPSDTQKWQLQQLKTMSGQKFERAYTTLEIADHMEDIEQTQMELQKGSSAAIKHLASTALPMLRVHLMLSKLAYKAAV